MSVHGLQGKQKYMNVYPSEGTQTILEMHSY